MPEEKTPPAPPTVPQFDVRVCIVCREPMAYLSCKYICRRCGTMIDCSDAF
jgi:hypothetical protein